MPFSVVEWIKVDVFGSYRVMAKEVGEGNSSSGKMSISEDEGFFFSSVRNESFSAEDFLASKSWERDRKYRTRENNSKPIIFIKICSKILLSQLTEQCVEGNSAKYLDGIEHIKLSENIGCDIEQDIRPAQHRSWIFSLGSMFANKRKK